MSSAENIIMSLNFISSAFTRKYEHKVQDCHLKTQPTYFFIEIVYEPHNPTQLKNVYSG